MLLDLYVLILIFVSGRQYTEIVLKNLAEVLEFYDSIGAIELTDVYSEFTAEEKADFTLQIESKSKLNFSYLS